MIGLGPGPSSDCTRVQSGVPRALVVYGYEPSGHSAAAFALESALRTRGVVVDRIEVAADHHPFAGKLTALGYHEFLRMAPGLWGTLYASHFAYSILRVVRGAYLSFGGVRRLRERVRRFRADLVVCPQAAVAAVLSAARARGELDIPVVSALTDYGVHPFWADPPADLILAPDEAAVDALAALGVPRERLRSTGIPVHPAFAAPPSREDARLFLALPPAAPVVLLSGGGKGLGGLDRAVAALLAASPRARVLLLCGANDRLRAALSRRSGDRLRVFGPQPPEFVAAMMAAADVHIGKPGGLSSAESLAMGLPLVFLEPLPGQEESNVRRLLSIGAALDGGSPEQAARRAAELLENPKAMVAMHAAARRAGRPGAATAAAGAIEALVFDRSRPFLLQ